MGLFDSLFGKHPRCQRYGKEAQTTHLDDFHRMAPKLDDFGNRVILCASC